MNFSSFFSTLLLAALSFRVGGSDAERNLIVGGDVVTDPDDSPHVPFIVGLRRVQNGDTTVDQSIVCGGVLIAPDVVLTIGHCLDYDDLLLVRCYFGSTSRIGAPGYSSEGVQEIEADSWDVDELENVTETSFVSPALALIFLESEVRDIEPINVKVNPFGPLQGTGLNMVGYGTYVDEAGNLALSPTLRDAEMEVDFTTRCNEVYDNAVDNVHMFCAGGNGTGACSGDAGAPVIDGEGDVVGVVLYSGSECGSKPTIFSRVGAFTSFLKDEICYRDEIYAPEWCTFEPPAPGGGIFGCFPESSNVEVQKESGEKQTVSMSELSIGDHVHVGNGIFEPVYSFGHNDPSAKSNMLQIKMADNGKSPLRLSPNHMVVTKSRGTIPASQVHVGDELIMSDGMDIVKSVRKNVLSRGLYAPFTPSGKIVVDGIVASTYVAFQDSEGFEFVSWKISHQWVAHAGSFPLRVSCYYFGNTCKDETYTADGISTVVPYSLAFVDNLFGSIDNGGWFIRIPLIIFMVLVAALFSVTEFIILNPVLCFASAFCLLGVTATRTSFTMKTKVV